MYLYQYIWHCKKCRKPMSIEAWYVVNHVCRTEGCEMNGRYNGV